ACRRGPPSASRAQSRRSSPSACAGCSSRSNSSLPCLAPGFPRLRGFNCVSLPEREIECGQQGTRLVVGLGRGADRDVHAAGFRNLVEIDFGENDVLLEAERVVAAAVEALRIEATEVAHAR